LSGEIDGPAAPQLEKELTAVLERGDVRLVVDFGGVTFIASAGLRVFLSFAKKVQRAGGKIVLSSMSPAVHNVFETVGFTSIFPIHRSHEEAIEALGTQ
jgi:anti-anti-sigma factor